MRNIIHIYGAAGSGTTTLGRKLSEELGYFFMDTDEYFWLPSSPPYTTRREPRERLEMMKRDIERAENVVLSGALVDWGDELIPYFTLVIRLETATDIRMERIVDRENRNWGERIHPGGDMYEHHLWFKEWAASYDTAGLDTRSRMQHEEWQKLLGCEHMILNGGNSLEDNVEIIKKRVEVFRSQENGI